MSSRGRRRKSGSNQGNQNNSSGSQANGSKNSNKGRQPKQGKQGKQGKQKAPKFDAADFWGDADDLPEPHGYDVEATDPTAILRSLGRPPIPGSEAAAEHHFTMIYERSGMLATALAAAGGLGEIQASPDADAS